MLRTVENYFEAELHSPITKPFYDATTITGAALLSVWSPSSTKFRLKGWHIVAVVRTAFTPTNPVLFGLWDNSTAAAVMGLASFSTTTNIGDQWLCTTPVRWSGHTSATASNVLKLGCDATISSGVISVMGCVWGDEV